MGLGGISVWQLLIILVIVILVFGTKRLKTLGGDLGGALKSFRKAMDQNDEDKSSGSAGDDQKQIESGERPDADFSEQTKSQEHK